MKTLISYIACVLAPACLLAQPLEPYRHNFFTTNPAPVVDVLPGTNVSVQFTTTGTSQRHYTVNTDTNLIPIYAGYVTNGYPWTNIPARAGNTAGRIVITTNNGVLDTVSTLLYDPVANQMIINENAVAGASSLVGTALSVRGADNAQIRIGVSSFGIAGAGAFAIRHARGTAALPTAISTGDQIMSLEGWGYGTTGYGVAPSVTVRGNAADLWTDTSMPSYITFRTTPTNSLLPVERMRIDPVGVVSLKYDSIGTSITPDLWLTNSTASALGVQQNSPALMLGGQGWKSGDSTTHPVSMGWYTLPVQGSSSDPLGVLSAATSVSGAAPSAAGFYVRSDGKVGIGGISTANTAWVNGNLSINSGAFIGFTGNSAITTANFGLYGDVSQTVLNGPTPGWVSFRIANSEKIRMDQNGNLGIGTNSPQAKLHVELDALGTTIVPGLLLSNATAAALGAQQNSPALMLGGQGWRSGNSTTHSTAMGLYLLPVQGSSADPTMRLTVVKSIDGAPPSAVGAGSYFLDDGSLFVGNVMQADGHIKAGSISAISWNTRSEMYSPASGDIRYVGVGNGPFSRLFLGPATSDWLALKVETTNSPTLSIRTGNDGNYASLMASNITSKSDSLGANIVPSVWLTNATAAALGAQQNSPALMLGGQGWRSGNSTTMPVQMGLHVMPIQGTSANPSARLYLSASISNAPPSLTSFFITDGGNVNGFSYTIASSGSFEVSSKSKIFSPIDGWWTFNNQNEDGFTGLIFGIGKSPTLLSQSTNWPALRVENSTNNVTLGVRRGTNQFEFANLVANRITSSNYFTGDTVILTNGMAFVTAPTNGVAPPDRVQQPLGMFGSMMMATVTNTLTVGSSGTYYVVSNYTTIRTNGFVAVPSTGYLTNLYAGFYRISYFMSAIPGNADQVELEIFINGTGREEIASFHTYDNPARVDTMNGDGILYLPANSYVNLAANNRSGANNITIWRCGLTIGTP